MFSSSLDSDWRSVTSSNSAIRNSGRPSSVAHDHAVGGEDPFLRTALDHDLAAKLAIHRVQRRIVGRFDARRGIGREYLVGTLADNLVTGKAREALERTVGENVAAIANALGGDADRNIVEYRLQELPGRVKLARKLALFGAILVRRDRAAIGQREILGPDRTPTGQLGDQAIGHAGVGIEILRADVEHAARAPHRQQFGPGHVRRNVGVLQSVDFEIAIIAIDDPLARIRHHDALIEIVQGGTDKGVSAQLRAFHLAQCREDPERDGGQKRADHHAADQHFPDHFGIGGADIARGRKAVRLGPRGAERHKGADQAYDGLRGNHNLATCLPILGSHQSLADFCGGVSGFTGLDRVNAYPPPARNVT